MPTFLKTFVCIGYVDHIEATGVAQVPNVLDTAGNLRTSDFGGPYNLSLLSVQEAEVKSGIAARQNFSDADIVNFLTNVE